MKFTVIFNSIESFDFSFGLDFIPYPVWLQGSRIIMEMKSGSKSYKPGSVKKLLKAFPIIQECISDKECIVIVHRSGQGNEHDMIALQSDLLNNGFRIQSHFSGFSKKVKADEINVDNNGGMNIRTKDTESSLFRHFHSLGYTNKEIESINRVLLEDR